MEIAIEHIEEEKSKLKNIEGKIEIVTCQIVNASLKCTSSDHSSQRTGRLKASAAP